MSARRIALFLAFVLVPATSLGATVSETLRTPADEAVTRGDFIRGAVTVLGIPLKGTSALAFKRPVPKNLQPYVRAANDKKALAVFGSDLGLTQPVTRGEAAQVLAKLKGLSAKGTLKTYADAKKGSDLEEALNIAVSRGWMKPLRAATFGANATLTGDEARALLRKVIGESASGDKPKDVEIRILTPQKPKGDNPRNVWQILNKEYLYNDRLTPDSANLGSAADVVNSVKDPYTIFMPPSESKNFQDTLHGEVVGIGAQVEIISGVLTVTSPLAGSPADKAGIKPGDTILKVDGKSTDGLALTDAVLKIRGEEGTTVVLTVGRGDTQVEIKIRRAKVTLPEITVTKQEDTALVRILQFGDQTREKIRDVFAEVAKDSPKGIILDLRNNPGGYLEAAGETLSNFLPEGSVFVNIKTRTQEYGDLTQDAPTVPKDIPMIVLVNEGSASASEIVAGALQDTQRAKILGQKTFGKGTVQEVLGFADGSSLKMTIAEWFTPSKNKINGVGVIPDIQVQNTADRDEQLLKALELLR